MKTLLIFGLGYSSQAVVAAAKGRYARIIATVRSPERAARLTASGLAGAAVTVLPFSGQAFSEDLDEALASADDVLVSIPPDAGGDPVLRAAEARMDATLVHAIVYLSTVGVYGDHQGAWVDEATPPRPESVRSHERLAAEQAWAAFGRNNGVPVTVLRLAGIYGPGQNALVNLAAGTARRIVKPGQVFNRIHVADIAQAVLAAFDKRLDGIVNVTDDEPAPPQDVIAFAAGLMGVPVPPDVPFEAAELSPMARSFYAECKRVSNRRLKSELGVNLLHPNFREALQALAAGGDAQ